MATKSKSKSPTQLKEELATARRAARNAQNRLKAYKEGFVDGIRLAKDARQ